MRTDPPYSAVVISGKLIVALRELSAAEAELELELQVNGKPRGRIHFRPWFLPRLAIGGEELLLWGGCRAYFLSIVGGSIRRFDFHDEIHGAYRLSRLWCLVCETSVALWSPEEGVSLAEYPHDEVILTSWWEAERLIAEDLQHRRYEVEIDERNLCICLLPQVAGENTTGAIGATDVNRRTP